MPLNKINIYKGLNKKVFYNYNNLLGSPVDALSINVLINADLVYIQLKFNKIQNFFIRKF